VPRRCWTRTSAAAVVPSAIVNTQRDRPQREERLWNDITALVRIVTVFVIVVAACSLTVGAVGAMFERRRPFALLRASGVRLGELRRVMLIETTVPMVFTTLLGVGLGLAASYGEQLYDDERRTPPGADLIAGRWTTVRILGSLGYGSDPNSTRSEPLRTVGAQPIRYARMIVSVTVLPDRSVAFARSDTNPAPAGCRTTAIQLPPVRLSSAGRHV
jgi:hypothetical protein